MKMDLLVPLVFLSRYKYSFLLTDLLLFLLMSVVYFIIAYKILPGFIPEERLQRFEDLKKFVSLFLLVQLFFYIVLFSVLLISPVSPFTHLKSSIPFSGYIFVFMLITRIINTILLASFIVVSLKIADKEILKNYSIVAWILLFVMIWCYYVYTLFYSIFPVFNKTLIIYETFYHIRTLFITKDPEKIKKSREYISGLICSLGNPVPEQYRAVFKQQWGLTFKNKTLQYSCKKYDL